MPVYQLDEGLWFPNPIYGEPDGLFAVGGDLSVNRLLLAYSHGIFPWYAYQLYDEPPLVLSHGTFCHLPQGDTHKPLHETTHTPGQVPHHHRP